MIFKILEHFICHRAAYRIVNYVIQIVIDSHLASLQTSNKSDEPVSGPPFDNTLILITGITLISWNPAKQFSVKEVFSDRFKFST